MGSHGEPVADGKINGAIIKKNRFFGWRKNWRAMSVKMNALFAMAPKMIRKKLQIGGEAIKKCFRIRAGISIDPACIDLCR